MFENFSFIHYLSPRLIEKYQAFQALLKRMGMSVNNRLVTFLAVGIVVLYLSAVMPLVNGTVVLFSILFIRYFSGQSCKVSRMQRYEVLAGRGVRVYLLFLW